MVTPNNDLLGTSLTFLDLRSGYFVINMAPSKSSKQELTRARVARDAALNSIRKIHALALEADTDEHKRPIFFARHGH